MLFKNIPILLIVVPLGLSSLIAVLKPKDSKALMLFINILCVGLGAYLLYEICRVGGAFTVKMGEVGAPFGNELYVSKTEALVVVGFDLIELLSLLAGGARIKENVSPNRISLFYTVCSLLLAALNALSFTNDIFTGYVFIEITTIAAGALIFAGKQEGTLLASMRYMIMNLLGSGLFLFGLAVIYSLTGELLFPQMLEKVGGITTGGKYTGALFTGLTLMSLGLSMKSALYPFHTWLPNAYSLSTPAASSLLSSLVSKAYIFLYIKIIARGVGINAFVESGASDIMLVYSAFAIVVGSWDAIRQHNVRRMISYSSVAQIGYIFMAVSLGTKEALAAAVFQIFAHSAAKAMLFPAVDSLINVSGGNENFRDLRGSGYRAPLSGLAFTIGAFSIVGIPLLGGFSGKLFIASAAYEAGQLKLYAVLAAFSISTVLNIIYFLRTVVTVYRKSALRSNKSEWNFRASYICSVTCFMALNLYLGAGASGVMKIISDGIKLW